jgi:hypothetical protein
MGTLLRVKENNSVTVNASVLSSAGAPENITSWSFEFKVVTRGTGVILLTKSTSDATQIAILDGAAGTLQVYLLPADTAGQRGDYWEYELKGTDTLGRAVTLAQGSFFIQPTII